MHHRVRILAFRLYRFLGISALKSGYVVHAAERERSYVAVVHADGPGAHWRTNPLPVSITRRPATSASTLRIAMAPGGRQAIGIRPQ